MLKTMQSTTRVRMIAQPRHQQELQPVQRRAAGQAQDQHRDEHHDTPVRQSL